MGLSSRVYRKSWVLVIGTLVISALAASPASARKTRVQSTGSEQCWVVPNPVTKCTSDSCGQFTVNGSGFTPGQKLDVFIGGTVLFSYADSFGNFSTWTWAQFTSSGTYTAYVYQMGDTRKTVLASCSFQVQ